MFDIISLLITRLSKLSTLKLLVLLSFTFVINILVMKLIFGDDFDSFFSQNIDLILILFGLAYAAISAIRYLDSSIEEKRETEETNISKIESIVSSY
ncbi:hypothetical protein NQ798_17485, partial [Acinetobacter baumannii]|nr:hypothetical protein [Acinetobacter baumannii]